MRGLARSSITSAMPSKLCVSALISAQQCCESESLAVSGWPICPVQLRVTHRSSAFILGAVESGELDVGIVSAPKILSSRLNIAREFADEFVAIAPPNFPETGPISPGVLGEIFANKKWLLISDETTTGKRLRTWFHQNGVQPEVMMDADNFDLLINLVSMGMGVSMVPHRALALHPNTRTVRRIVVKPKFSRSLIVVSRRQRQAGALTGEFTDAVLF
jgi:DNA-binding transcriptional LysR family regulator